MLVIASHNVNHPHMVHCTESNDGVIQHVALKSLSFYVLLLTHSFDLRISIFFPILFEVIGCLTS